MIMNLLSLMSVGLMMMNLRIDDQHLGAGQNCERNLTSLVMKFGGDGDGDDDEQQQPKIVVHGGTERRQPNMGASAAGGADVCEHAAQSFSCYPTREQ